MAGRRFCFKHLEQQMFTRLKALFLERRHHPRLDDAGPVDAVVRLLREKQTKLEANRPQKALRLSPAGSYTVAVSIAGRRAQASSTLRNER